MRTGPILLGPSVLTVVATAGLALGVAITILSSGHDGASEVEAVGAGVDLSLAIDGVCDTVGGDVKCGILEDTSFDVSVSIEDISAITEGAYEGLDVLIEYTGALSSNGVLSAGPWPDCYFEANASGPGYEAAGCTIGIAAPPSTHTGVVVTGSFHCGQGEGALNLHHGFTGIVAQPGSVYHDKGSDSITVNCEAATPTPAKLPPPGDTDGDGCPDADENGPDEDFGGRRDYLNPWDYFNPTNDGQNRVDDIMAVLERYTGPAYHDPTGDPFTEPPPPPAYHPKFDRTLVGPEEWDLGPPNGYVTAEDILLIAKQYFHDCGTGVIKPTPAPTSAVTPTPTQSPTPTVTPTPTPLPNPLDFSIGVDVNGDTVDDCDTSGGPTKCTVPTDSTFALTAYLNGLPDGVSSYGGFDLRVDYEGVSSKDNADTDPWPDCGFAASYYEPGVVIWGCAIGVEEPPSAYGGPIGSNDFNCEADGMITMVHGTGAGTHLVEDIGSVHLEGEGATESLTINCY